MMEQKGKEIQVLVADSQQEQLENLRIYAACRPGVRLCGCVSDGAAVLEALQDAERVDVLIMDMILGGVSALEVLHRLPGLRLSYRPRVILTTCVFSTVIQRKYLTAGADFILLKPYTADSLFEHAQMICCDDAEYLRRRIREKLVHALERFKAQPEDCGYWYIMELEQRLIPMRRACSMNKELYDTVAAQSGVSRAAVESGIRRSIESMDQPDNAQFLALRKYLGTPPERPVSNSAFLNRLAQMIWLELE